MPGYVDLHDHALPGVDDGAPDLDASLAMLRGLYDLGYRRVALTPHVRTGYWENRRPGLERVLASLREAVAAGEPDLADLDLRLGAENFLDDTLFDLLKRGELIPLGEGGHVLIELPATGVPPMLEEMLFQVQLEGLTPVLAHPERYQQLVTDRDRLRALQDHGTLLQVSVTSLSGKFGWRTKRSATKLIKDGLCDLVATDAHSPDDVAQYAAPGLDRLHKLVGAETARRLLEETPNAVLGA